MTRRTAPPRATFTRLKTGSMLGAPGDRAQQTRVLEATLSLLEQDAPLPPVKLEESC
ncbi:MAG: hypothetical protein OXS35_02090 [Dehalococcoidia bacterium]|nr:hypothetical protein [Dehalococcoidia bacterium]